MDTCAADPDDPSGLIASVIEWSGGQIAESLMTRLNEFHSWLLDEAIPAGGLGPNEGPRLWRRHIADSLTYLRCILDARTVLDVGSGVGLPGIPLAIAQSSMSFTLLDRSGRRCRLARRAVRLLDLENVEVVCADLMQHSGVYDAVISRATIPPDELVGAASHVVGAGGAIITGGSHLEAPSAVGALWEVIEVPSEVIGGGGSWLLRTSLDGGDSDYAPRHDRSG